MTTGFQQQDTSLNFTIPKTAPTPHQVGRKLKTAPDLKARPPEPRSFK